MTNAPTRSAFVRQDMTENIAKISPTCHPNNKAIAWISRVVPTVLRAKSTTTALRVNALKISAPRAMEQGWRAITAITTITAAAARVNVKAAKKISSGCAFRLT
ncbi:MAG: hypothetical protein MUO77_15695 [Anaerolineales bacterium]|nr:hypothetical protein [Anaerolineales bacterium]